MSSKSIIFGVSWVASGAWIGKCLGQGGVRVRAGCFLLNAFFRSSYFFPILAPTNSSYVSQHTLTQTKTPQSVSGKVNLFQTSSQCSYFSDSWTSKGKVIQQHLCDTISVLFTNSGPFQISPSLLL